MSRGIVHVDVDNLWVYENEYSFKTGRGVDYLYADVMPRFLDLFDQHQRLATFFVIGRDLEQSAEARRFIREAHRRGHEIANHSFSHPQSFRRLKDAQARREIQRCHELIENAIDASPRGHRGPGYYVDRRMGRILEELGYVYDSSVLPGWASTLMSIAYLLRNRGAFFEKDFGRGPKDLFETSRRRPLFPGSALVELPLSVLPLLRLAFHTTFVYQLGWAYWRLAKSMLSLGTSGYTIMLFHAVDLLDFGDTPAGSILPSRWPLVEKRLLLGEMLSLPGVRYTSTLGYLQEHDVIVHPTRGQINDITV